MQSLHFLILPRSYLRFKTYTPHLRVDNHQSKDRGHLSPLVQLVLPNLHINSRVRRRFRLGPLSNWEDRMGYRLYHNSCHTHQTSHSIYQIKIFCHRQV